VRTVAVVSGGPQGPGPASGARPHPVDGFDLVQTYEMPGDFRDTIVAARGEPPAHVPETVPVMLDLEYGSRPDTEALHKHWERAARMRNPVMLGGSLDPDNVAEAIAVAHPWAVDTSRGVESSPGVKDHDRVRAFVHNAKEAS
jgi:N-(5'phosphoribosyl)anthranilate (PRA) isomerase